MCPAAHSQALLTLAQNSQAEKLKNARRDVTDVLVLQIYAETEDATERDEFKRKALRLYRHGTRGQRRQSAC